MNGGYNAKRNFWRGFIGRFRVCINDNNILFLKKEVNYE
jgi:hypothetical protein